MSVWSAPVGTGTAELGGTFRIPFFRVTLHQFAHHPKTNEPIVDWLKANASAQWDRYTKTWTVYGLNSPDPVRLLTDAGIIVADPAAALAEMGVSSVTDLVPPLAKLSSDGRTVFARPRLAGTELGKKLVGVGAVWDADRDFFRMYAADVIDPKTMQPRPGVLWPQDAIDFAYTLHQHRPTPAEFEKVAAHLGSALNMDRVSRTTRDKIGILPPAAGGRELFPYQEAGVFAAVAGHRGIWDEPGLGKTLQTLTAIRMLGAKKILMVVPPLLTTNWAREAVMAGVVEQVDDVVRFRTGRKEPALPDEGVVIIADSLLAARPDTKERIKQWGADAMLLDEAHRAMTIGAKRAEAVLEVAVTVKHTPFALTGTPILSTPAQLVNLLELTRTLAPVFGGRSQFLEDFCRWQQFGGRQGKWVAKKDALPRLNALLKEHVWVRRRKTDALPQLPPKRRRALVVDVPLKDYRETHKAVIAKVHGWLTWFNDHYGHPPEQQDIDDYKSRSSFEFVSQLAQAAGLAKVPAAQEWIRNHIEETGRNPDGTYARPLIVWAHHKSVEHAIAESLGDSVDWAMIVGDTPDRARDEAVDLFQAGKLGVLIASIKKAGVGLTLTRGSDALFAEGWWVPADILQAEDRLNRISAINPSLYTTLIAHGTLDEPMQRVVNAKAEVIEKATNDAAAEVSIMSNDDAATLSEIIGSVIDEAVRTHKPAMQKAA